MYACKLSIVVFRAEVANFLRCVGNFHAASVGNFKVEIKKYYDVGVLGFAGASSLSLSSSSGCVSAVRWSPLLGTGAGEHSEGALLVLDSPV